MRNRANVITGLVGLLAASAASITSAADNPAPPTPPPAFAQNLPPSELTSAESRAVLARQSKEMTEFSKLCPLSFTSLKTRDDLIAFSKCYDEHFYPAVLARMRARYQVDIAPQTIAGVATEVFTPAAGIAPANRQRILINIHGGAFLIGARWGGQTESIPISAVGRIQVVSVDYRELPDDHFPAGTEDVVKVYRALLKDHQPGNIGIYGCSAGGILTAETVALLQKEKLPRPGAVGMFCFGAHTLAGDSDQGGLHWPADDSPSAYFRGADFKNPLAFPGLDETIMARFPPSLLISSTRDFCLSSVVATHAQLVRLGVPAELHVWEGHAHAFLVEPDFPESREAYEVIAKFFNSRLGKPAAGTR